MTMSLLIARCFLLIALWNVVQAHDEVQNIPEHPKPIICLPNNRLPRDCAEVYKAGRTNNGVYLIQPKGCSTPYKIWCDISRTEGWTVIMARFNGLEKFNRSWAEYKAGFGDVYGEYWLGNERIFHLTNQRHYKLRVEFRYWPDLNSQTADYTGFMIESEDDNYMLHIGKFLSCTSGYNGLSYHNEMYFSTYDRDHDLHKTGNCAANHGGGFCYKGCHHANPTGLYKMSCHRNNCMEWNRKPTKVMILKIAPSTTI